MADVFDPIIQWLTFEAYAPWWAIVLVSVSAMVALWSQSAWATIIHELGHAIVASMLGMNVESISLRSNSSGLTQSSYRVAPGLRGLLGAPFRWVRNILVKAAGYPAPFVFALCASASAYFGVGRVFLCLCLVGCLYTFVKAENWFGRGISLASAVIVTAFVLADNPLALGLILAFLYGVGLGGGARGLHSLWCATYRGEKDHSDAHDLAVITLIPTVIWVGLFFLGSLIVAVLSVFLWL